MNEYSFNSGCLQCIHRRGSQVGEERRGEGEETEEEEEEVVNVVVVRVEC